MSERPSLLLTRVHCPLLEICRLPTLSLMEHMHRVVELPGSPLLGPPTAPWFVDAVTRSGLASMVSRDTRWEAESGIVKTDRVVYGHECLSRAVELAAVVDCLNVKNLVCFGFLLRRLQLVEEAVAENPSQPDYSGASHYVGTEERRGGALLAPSLRAYVAGELGKEAAILKEARDARGGGFEGWRWRGPRFGNDRAPAFMSSVFPAGESSAPLLAHLDKTDRRTSRPLCQQRDPRGAERFGPAALSLLPWFPRLRTACSICLLYPPSRAQALGAAGRFGFASGVDSLYGGKRMKLLTR